MKTSHFIKLAGAVLVVCGTRALAAEQATKFEERPSSPFYLHSDVGPTYMQDLKFQGGGSQRMKAGVRGDIAFGYNINECFAAELETGAIWNRTEGSAIDFYQIP